MISEARAGGEKKVDDVFEGGQCSVTPDKKAARTCRGASWTCSFPCTPYNRIGRRAWQCAWTTALERAKGHLFLSYSVGKGEIFVDEAVRAGACSGWSSVGTTTSSADDNTAG